MLKKKKLFPTRRRVPFIEQMQQTECALCCIAMISSYYKNDLSMYEVRERMGNGRDGTTLFHLKKLAEQLNFDTKSYKADSQATGDSYTASNPVLGKQSFRYSREGCTTSLYNR
ncbi:cysteine peptidase family C39 domain-containing protein [Bacillus sonorensis]|nr:cysteine peptidase family C39 domain-containing protein [Bacillus sonorensis]